MELQGQISLAPLTTLGLGGRAEFFADIASVAELSELRDYSLKRGLPLTVLGGGSNALIPDEGVGGVVFRFGARSLDVVSDLKDRVIIDVGAGLSWDSFVAWSVERGLWGLECLSGIPGWVGASPIQNIGAYGAELGDVLESVELFDMRKGALLRLQATALGLGYRESHLKRAWRGRYVVVGIRVSLSKVARPRLGYKDLSDLANRDESPGLHEIRSRVLEVRAAKSMLADPSDPNAQSLGSFFVNPVVDGTSLERIEAVAVERALGAVPKHSVGDGWKVPAAWLIERSGFTRGTQVGRVGISTKHALALIHLGDGRTQELLAFSEQIKDRCFETFGVRLEREPQPLESLSLE